MRNYFLLFLCVLLLGFSTFAADTVTSTMKNLPATYDSRGVHLIRLTDHPVSTSNLDLAPPQYFEIVRPNMEPLIINRLYTSCSCIVLSAPKRKYAQGERAIVELRNIRPTPINGQNYSIYVKISKPISEVIRYDTFVQTGFPAKVIVEESVTQQNVQDQSTPANTDIQVVEEVDAIIIIEDKTISNEDASAISTNNSITQAAAIQAEEIKNLAAQQAAKIKQEAQAQAEAIIKAAAERSAEIRELTANRTDQIQTLATQRAEKILLEAEEQAQEIQSSAYKKSEELKSDALLKTEEIKQATAAKSEELKKFTEKKADELTKTADNKVDEINRAAEAELKSIEEEYNKIQSSITPSPATNPASTSKESETPSPAGDTTVNISDDLKGVEKYVGETFEESLDIQETKAPTQPTDSPSKSSTTTSSSNNISDDLTAVENYMGKSFEESLDIQEIKPENTK